MNRDENLTYEWLRNLRKKLLKEEAAQTQQVQKCPPQYPLAASAVSPKWAGLWGDFCYNEGGAESSIIIDPNWVAQNIVTINLGGRQVKVNKVIAETLPQAYEAAVKASNYKPSIGGREGPWQPRHVQLGGVKPGISGHSWGMAIDFDPAANDPNSKDIIIKQHPEFINTMKQYGFAWLAEDDPMHFYYDKATAGNQPMYSSSDVAGAGGMGSYSNWKTHAVTALRNLGIPDNPLGITESADKLLNPKDKFKVKDKTKDQRLEKNKKVLLDMLSFYDEKLKFEKPVLIKFVDDEKNAGELLGKTAFYDPNKSSITIFTTNRLLKDILRSLGHELVHHKQHCKDEFHDTQTFEGYAQKDKKLRRKEKEAYLFGNMLFRDWEDNYKSNHKETR